jgi:hypothetical protein
MKFSIKQTTEDSNILKCANFCLKINPDPWIDQIRKNVHPKSL